MTDRQEATERGGSEWTTIEGVGYGLLVAAAGIGVTIRLVNQTPDGPLGAVASAGGGLATLGVLTLVVYALPKGKLKVRA